MSTTVVQTSSQSSQAPMSQQQPSVIQLHTVHHQTTTTTTSNNGSLPGGYNRKAAVISGSMQIICGSVLVLFGVIALSVGSTYRSAWNIWGGICFYILTGILGLVSKHRNRCIIVAYMVMSIISAICAGGQIIYDSIASAVQSNYCIDYSYDIYSWSGYNCHVNTGAIAIHALAAVVGFVEMIVAIVASAYCCCGSCNDMPSQTVIHYAQPYPGGQVTVVAAPGTYQTQGPAIINPSQTYAMAPPPAYPPPPQYPGQPMYHHVDSPVGQVMSPHATQIIAGTPSSGPGGTRVSVDTVYSYPLNSPPAYSYTHPSNMEPVPVETVPRPDSTFK